MKVKTFKEIINILLFASIVALAFNIFQSNGISLIHSARELKWESDTLLNKMLADTTREINGIMIPKEIDLKEEKKGIKSDSGSIINKMTGNTRFNDTMLNVKHIDSIPRENIPKPIEPTAITIEQAYRIFNNGGSLFIDARKETEFKYGHIKGAINIPFNKFDQMKDMLNNINKERLIVTYCDGRGCDESIELAHKIFQSGFINVKIFYGGWMDWKTANYPID